VIGSFHTDGTRVIDQPPFDVGPALSSPPAPAGTQPCEGRFRVTGPRGTDLVIGAEHNRLGINPAGAFAAAALGGTHAGGAR
jgi:hypothetical protein